jgi:hypothetical protein
MHSWRFQALDNRLHDLQSSREALRVAAAALDKSEHDLYNKCAACCSLACCIIKLVQPLKTRCMGSRLLRHVPEQSVNCLPVLHACELCSRHTRGKNRGLSLADAIKDDARLAHLGEDEILREFRERVGGGQFDRTGRNC